MNVTYMRARKKAADAIRKYGSKFYYENQGGGYITWDSDLVTFDQEPPYAWAVVFPPGTGTQDEFGAETGGIMDLSGYRKFLMSTEGLDARPQAQDQVAYQGEWWTIKSVANLNPDGKLDIFYTGILQRV